MAPPQWVVLHRSPLVLPKGAGTSLALAAPPRISQLQVPPSLVVSRSAVLAADPIGILLLSACRGTDQQLAADEPTISASYNLWDAVSKTSTHVPAPEATLNDNDTGGVAAGLVVVRKFGKHRVMVAELSVRDSTATLRCFSTETCRWTHKNLRSPPIMVKQRRQWCSAYALSYRGRLWWVDLSLGLLACDPFADNPELHWVPLPSLPQVGDRCVSLSCGKLRLVVINNNNRRRTHHQPSIKLWTLADYEAGKWSLDFDIPIEHIGGLPKDKERPPMLLAFVHPSNAHVVYFSLEQQLFSVDLQTNKVTESASIGREDSGGDHLLAWEPPQSLRVPLMPAGPSPTQESRFKSHFNSVADSFCEAYGHAFADMESYKLSNIALAYLNRKKKPEDKFKLSERLFLQTFVEDTRIKIKKYAHLNFYADTGSKKVLVFAEFHTDAVGDEGGLCYHAKP